MPSYGGWISHTHCWGLATVFWEDLPGSTWPLWDWGFLRDPGNYRAGYVHFFLSLRSLSLPSLLSPLASIPLHCALQIPLFPVPPQDCFLPTPHPVRPPSPGGPQQSKGQSRACGCLGDGGRKSKLTPLELRRNYPELVSPPTFQGASLLSPAWIHYYILL